MFGVALTMNSDIVLMISGVAALLALALSVQYAWWRPTVDWKHARVLMYHMISEHREGARFNKLRVLPGEFEKQIAWLKSQGFTFVFASQLCDKTRLPPKAVCLTFDDGYADNLLAADPVLQKYGAVATLYLVGDLASGWSSKKKSHHGDDELRDEPKLNDAQVRQMLESGRWELGGHTITHANLPTLDNDDAKKEIENARDDFAKRFGVCPKTFAYPFGLFGNRDAELTRNAGFSGAVTTDSGVFRAKQDDAWRIKRIKVSGREGMFPFRIRIRTSKRGLLK